MVFGLKGNGLALVAPVQDLGFAAHPLPRPTFFVLSPWAIHPQNFRVEWAAHQSIFEPIEIQVRQRSHLVRFDSQSEADRLQAGPYWSPKWLWRFKQ